MQARIAALEAQKAEAETLAAMAAHELVEPLIATAAYASMVADRLVGDLHAQSRTDLETLQRGSAHARTVVSTLLCHAGAAHRPLERGPVDAGAVVRDCVRLFAPEIAFREAHVEIGELPDVSGEEALIRALFVNLLSNALKHGPRRGTTIEITATLLHGSCRFCVRSNGETIPLEDRARIFSSFRRGRGEPRVRGAGLGLAICRHIVERHGGRIWVGAARGGGNRFCFTLPR